MIVSKHLLCGVCLSLLLVLSSSAQAKPPLGKTWPANQRVSIGKIDHAAFDVLLEKYVDGEGYVDYAAWQKSRADRKALLSYLSQLSRASRKYRAGQDARLAYWINAYNAVTIEGILQVYPTSSIRNHTARVFGYNIWKELPLRVGGTQYSLEQMEHQILRKMNEPRIHLAIVCASISCPKLRSEAYTSSKVQSQLAANTREFFASPKHFRYSTSKRTMFVSPILNWFADDFGSNQVRRFAYLKPYLPKGARPLATDSRTTVRYLEYDWGVNDRAKRLKTASRNRKAR